MLTGDGRVVTATPTNEHADLFRGFPNSYGTLGYALRLRIELEPVHPYVTLTHSRLPRRRGRSLPRWRLPCRSATPWRTSTSTSSTARSSSARRDVPDRRHLGRRGALHLGLHGQPDLLPVGPAALPRLPDRPRLPLALGHRLVLVLARDVRAEARGCARWCPSACCAPTCTGRSSASSVGTAGRRALDQRRAARPSRSPSSRTSRSRSTALPEFLDFFHREVGIAPVWICPMRQRDASRDVGPLRARPRDHLRQRRLLVGGGRSPAGEVDGYHNRRIEQEVAELGGRKSLYSTSFYSEEEFWATYNGASVRRAQEDLRPGRATARPLREDRAGRR